MQKNAEKVVVMGLGYIGLPTASMLATKGHAVLGVDINREVADVINSGKIHIVEPDLDILVKSAVNSGNLRAGTVPEEADAFIIAVPTPFQPGESGVKTPDVSYVSAATESLIPYLREGNLVILESTSPVGTTEMIYGLILGARPELSGKLHVAHCPERVLPGHIIRELVDNDRIIGGIDRSSAEKARELYRTFCAGAIYLTDSKTAELAKLAENAFRDVNIAFANELSVICDGLGIDVWQLIALANRHPRVNILSPGPGVGGHCIAVDPWFIVSSAPADARLIRTAREVNDAKPQWVIKKVKKAAERFKNPVIGCLGLSYKANIDDLRESPAAWIARELMRSHIGRILLCEPNLSGDFCGEPLTDLDTAVRESDVVVILVDHDEFRDLGRDALLGKSVIDTRGIWR